MCMIFFYNKNNGNIYSYIAYNLEYSGETLLNRPPLEKCSINNNVNTVDIKIAEFLIENPTYNDFKGNTDDLNAEDYNDI